MTVIRKNRRPSFVTMAQVTSLVVMWVFVISISVWILNLLLLSIELQDALEASIAIGLVAIPVYVTLASILTYVFVGLQREERRLMRDSSSTQS